MNKKQIGIISSAYFDLTNYKTNIKLLKSDGYDTADFQEFMPIDGKIHTMPIEEFEILLKDIKKEAKKIGVEFYQCHGTWRTNDETEENRQKAIESFKRDIYGAHLLGSHNLVIHPCLPFGWGIDKDPNFTYEKNLERFKALIPLAENFDVNICIENMPFTAYEISKVDNLIKLVDELNNSHIKICLDIGHAHVFKDNLFDDIVKIGSRLSAIHIHDNNCKQDQHFIPFFGFIHFDDVINGLRQINYKGPFSLETIVPQSMPLNLKHEWNLQLNKIATFIANKI